MGKRIETGHRPSLSPPSAATSVTAGALNTDSVSPATPRHSPRFWMIIVALSLLSFISALDVTIIATALPPHHGAYWRCHTVCLDCQLICLCIGGFTTSNRAIVQHSRSANAFDHFHCAFHPRKRHCWRCPESCDAHRRQARTGRRC